MKKSITVLGVEAEGLRGIRLEESGAEWTVADSEFWTTAGAVAEDGVSSAAAGASSASDEDGSSLAEGATPEDRYSATVEALKAAAKRFGTREVVLSMPLASLLVKVSRTPVEARDRLAETADEELSKVSPFPDESPVTGMETVAETDQELVSLFAALPESGASEIGDALDEAKVRVVRTDVAALGWLRTLWPLIFGGGGTGNGESVAVAPQRSTRIVVLMDLDDGWDLVALDEGTPSLLRGLGRITDPSELGREVMLSLLRAGGSAEMKEIVVFSKTAIEGALVERLKAFAPLRSILLAGTGTEEQETTEDGRPTAFGGVEGVARRTQEGAALDVTPSDWGELRTEARFRRKLLAFLIAAAAGWVLLMGVLFGVPFAYGQMTEHQKTLSKRHSKAYLEVAETKKKAELVQQYSDHARGALEMLKAVSDRMPGGNAKLTSYSFKRGERILLVGEADQANDVFDFKDALADAATEDDEKLFAAVTLTGPSQSKGVHKFTIECLFEVEEDGK